MDMTVILFAAIVKAFDCDYEHDGVPKIYNLFVKQANGDIEGHVKRVIKRAAEDIESCRCSYGILDNDIKRLHEELNIDSVL